MRDNLSDILATHLEAIEAGERTLDECLEIHPEHREALNSLLSTAATVRVYADYAPRPGYQQASRAYLVKNISSHRTVTFGQFNRHILKKILPFHSRRAIVLWAVVLAMMISLIGVGAVSASVSALPGDALYGLKLAIEDVRLTISDPGQDTDLQIEFLQTRMAEIEALANNNRNEDLYPALDPLSDRINTAAQTLSSVAQNDAERAAQLAALLDLALSRHTLVLESLLETAPEQARPGIEKAIEASSKGRQVIHNLFMNGMPGGGPADGIPNPQATPKGKKPTKIPPEPTRRPPGPPGLTKEPSKPTHVPGGPATERPNKP